MLQVKKLSKSFGKRTVLDELDLSLDHGVYGLLGPNGSGKTTLIRCLTLLYPEGAKAVYFNEAPVTKNKQYLAKIGYLPQKFGLFPELTVSQSLEFFANIRGIGKREAQKRIADCLDLVNLTDRIDSKISSLSGGMVRRLGIAQALINEPQILLLDEPTAGLDPEERIRFKNIVSEIKQNRIIIISTHIVEDIEAVSEQILILKEGKIEVDGDADYVRSLAADKVYEVREDDLGLLRKDYYVFKKFEHEGEIMLRVLSNTQQNIAAVNPTIEDGYICTIRNI